MRYQTYKELQCIPQRWIYCIFPYSQGRGLTSPFLHLWNWDQDTSRTMLHPQAVNKQVGQCCSCLGGTLQQDQLHIINCKPWGLYQTKCFKPKLATAFNYYSRNRYYLQKHPLRNKATFEKWKMLFFFYFYFFIHVSNFRCLILKSSSYSPSSEMYASKS